MSGVSSPASFGVCRASQHFPQRQVHLPPLHLGLPHPTDPILPLQDIKLDPRCILQVLSEFSNLVGRKLHSTHDTTSLVQTECSLARLAILVANVLSVTFLAVAVYLPLLRNSAIIYRTFVLDWAYRFNVAF